MSIRRQLLAVLAATALLPALVPTLARAQESGAPVRRVISIGNHPRVDGLRLNFRDRELDLVRGANVTIWQPYDDVGGTVRGLALGLPSTGAGDLRGLGVGVFGVAAENEARGIMLGGVGVGAGNGLRGIAVGGVGVGAGGDVRGLMAGGIGTGVGGDARGILVGGIGAGVGGSARGILIGGVGAGVGGNVRGAAIGGIGVGAGGDARGLLVGGVGVGAGGHVNGLAIGGIGVGAGSGITGIAIGGIGVGAGGTLHGAAIGGLGVGAPRIEGIAIGTLVRTKRLHGVVIAPAMFRSLENAEVRGLTASGVNIVYGHQRGLAIGLVNYAESMNGLQLGGINIIRDNPTGRRVLPILNWGK